MREFIEQLATCSALMPDAAIGHQAKLDAMVAVASVELAPQRDLALAGDGINSSKILGRFIGRTPEIGQSVVSLRAQIRCANGAQRTLADIPPSFTGSRITQLGNTAEYLCESYMHRLGVE